MVIYLSYFRKQGKIKSPLGRNLPQDKVACQQRSNTTVSPLAPTGRYVVTLQTNLNSESTCGLEALNICHELTGPNTDL